MKVTWLGSGTPLKKHFPIKFPINLGGTPANPPWFGRGIYINATVSALHYLEIWVARASIKRFLPWCKARMFLRLDGINPPKIHPQGFRIYLRYRAGLQGLQEEHGWQCSDAIAAENYLGHQGASVEDRERVSKTMVFRHVSIQKKQMNWMNWMKPCICQAMEAETTRAQATAVKDHTKLTEALLGDFRRNFRFFFQLKGWGAMLKWDALLCWNLTKVISCSHAHGFFKL